VIVGRFIGIVSYLNKSKEHFVVVPRTYPRACLLEFDALIANNQIHCFIDR
jgi:hypothetical protein